MSKALKIIIVVAIITGLTVGIYFLWQYLNSRPVQKKDSSIMEQNNDFVSSLIKSTFAENVFDYWINKISREIYYITNNGNIFKTSGDTTQAITQQTFDLSYIKPSANGSAVLIAVGPSENMAFSVFNTAKRAFQALPQNVTAASWDPQSDDRLAVLYGTGTSGRLGILNLANLKITELTRLNQEGLDIEWISPELITLKEKPSPTIAYSVWSYNLKTRAVNNLIKEEVGLSVQWLKNGELGLKWSDGQLSLIDKANKELLKIQLKTLPRQCFFSEPFLYCAAPSNQIGLKASSLLDIILKKSPHPTDALYIAQVFGPGIAGSVLPLKIFDENFFRQDLNIDKINIYDDKLIFINQQDSKLYSLPL